MFIPHTSPGPGSVKSQLVGAALASRPELAQAASPVQFAHAAPPFQLIYGITDLLVPPRHSQRLAAALTAAGASATVELVPAEHHPGCAGWLGLGHCGSTVGSFPHPAPPTWRRLGSAAPHPRQAGAERPPSPPSRLAVSHP